MVLRHGVLKMQQLRVNEDSYILHVSFAAVQEWFLNALILDFHK